MIDRITSNAPLLMVQVPAWLSTFAETTKVVCTELVSGIQNTFLVPATRVRAETLCSVTLRRFPFETRFL